MDIRMRLVVCAVLAAAHAAEAQSLGEVARKEAERRGVVAPEGKVYTNDTLKPDPTAPVPAPADAPVSPSDAERMAVENEAAESQVNPAADGAPAESAPAAKAKPERGEAYWRGRAQEVRSKLNLKNAEVLSMRQRLNTLPPDSTEFEVSQGAFKSASHDLDAIKNEWKRLEDLARSKKVPDAWLR